MSKTETIAEDLADTGYEPVAIQRRMPGAGDVEANNNESGSGCPYEAAGLVRFAQLLSSLPAGADVTLPADGAFLLDASASIGGLTIPPGAKLVFADEPSLRLTATAVHVQGKLLLGSETCPLRAGGAGIVLAGAGDRSARSNEPLQTKGVTVSAGGVFEAFGTRYAPTWTRLAASAAPGAVELELQDEVDWQPGQEVVVVTTAWTDEPNNHQNEVRALLAVSGRRVILDRALGHGHYGGPEYAAEVALLSRSVTLQGDEQSEATRYGGHVICKRGSQCRLGGVAAFRMGQENGMGRYPFHLHLMGDIAGGSFFEDCLVRHSFFRAFTIHGTSGARVSRNAAYDISGSAYYLEDGVEEDNLFEFNLAAHVHIIKLLDDYEAGGGQQGVTVSTVAGRIVPTDATAVGFYCTNAKNRWIGNSASGGFSGFHFPTVPRALGDSYRANPDYVPDKQELLEFDSNTAHSSGRIWSRGACMYVGGKLWEEDKGSQDYRYQTGRASPPRMSGRFIFTNTKVFACRKGVLFWGTHWSASKPDLALEGFEAHDVSRSSSQLGDTYMHRAVVSAHTGNNLATDLPGSAEGFELYDTDMQTILADVTFRNFDRSGDVAIMDMTHSNIFKPQGMFNSKGLRFEGMPRERRFRHVHRLACETYHQDTCKRNCDACPGTTGSSQIANIVDSDGSALGWHLGSAILGADDTAEETDGETNEWWRIDDSCRHELAWGFWACPTLGHRSVVSLFIMKGIRSGAPGRTDPNTAVGRLYHFGRLNRHLHVGLAQSPMVSGPCCDIGWYLALDGGAQAGLTIFMDQMVPQGGLVFATAYPTGAEFTVQRCLPGCSDVHRGSGLQDVLDAPGTVYFVDEEGRLFLKLLHEGNGFFVAGGVTQLQNGNRFLSGQGARYTIQSSKVGNVPRLLPPPLSGDTGSPTTSWVPPMTTQPPRATSPRPDCADDWQGCLVTRCCSGAGMQCYEKDAYYAQCRPSCTPGINPSDPPQYQTPWSCTVLSRTTEGPATTPAAATTKVETTTVATTSTTTKAVGTTTVATTSTTAPATTRISSPDPGCAELWQGCLSTRCCNGAGLQCHEKNAYYAQCRPSCSPGINPSDPPQYQTPWSCTILMRSTTASPAGTTAAETTKVAASSTTTAAPTPAPVTTTTAGMQTTQPPTPAPRPPPSNCAGKWGACKRSRCCKNAGWQCYKKDRWYSQCRETCPSSGWNCKVLTPRVR